MATEEKPRSTVRLPRAPDLAAMQRFVATHSAKQVRSATDEAQTMMYDAWQKPTPRAQAVHTHKALAISPLCADAYNLLANQARTPEKALDLYMRGMEAAALVLGPEGLEEFDGGFWGFLETRPYMRARAGVALKLRKLQRFEEAAGHLRAMLKLNPNDNQGMRFVLLGTLFDLDQFEAAKALIGDYPDDDSLWWWYGQALIAFHDGRQDDPETLDTVRAALAANGQVVPVLAGRIPLVMLKSPYGAVGSPQEAGDYGREHGPAWRKLPGAVDWLIAAARITGGPTPESSTASSPE